MQTIYVTTKYEYNNKKGDKILQAKVSYVDMCCYQLDFKVYASLQTIDNIFVLGTFSCDYQTTWRHGILVTTNSATTYSATNLPGDTPVTNPSTPFFRSQLTRRHKIMPYLKPGDTDLYPELHPSATYLYPELHPGDTASPKQTFASPIL